MSWYCIHVHYHGGDLRALLLDGVQPFFAGLSGEVDRAYFVPHWRQGRHVRLNVRTSQQHFDTAVLPLARAVVGGYLAAAPSPSTEDGLALVPLHRRLAELEYDPGPLLPWRPDNSLHVVPFDSREQVLGGAAAAELLADFYTRSNALTFRLLDRATDQASRLTIAFELMVATAESCGSRGIQDGFVSFRSHAEAFLTGQPEGAGQRSSWDRHYRRNARGLVERMLAAVDAVHGRGGADYFPAWSEAITTYFNRGYELASAGELTMNVDLPTPSRPPVPLSTVSVFHRALEASTRFQTEVRPSLGFTAYRLVLNYTYLQLTRLGVTPEERVLLCHLAANAAEEAYGRSPVDVLNTPDETDLSGTRSARA